MYLSSVASDCGDHPTLSQPFEMLILTKKVQKSSNVPVILAYGPSFGVRRINLTSVGPDRIIATDVNPAIQDSCQRALDFIEGIGRLAADSGEVIEIKELNVSLGRDTPRTISRLPLSEGVKFCILRLEVPFTRI